MRILIAVSKSRYSCCQEALRKVPTEVPGAEGLLKGVELAVGE